MQNTEKQAKAQKHSKRSSRATAPQPVEFTPNIIHYLSNFNLQVSRMADAMQCLIKDANKLMPPREAKLKVVHRKKLKA